MYGRIRQGLMSTVKANTVKGVQSLLKSGVKGNYSAGNGLYLSVNGENVGSWLMRYQMDGKRQRMGFGSVDTVTLAEAREMAAEQKALIAKGINPKDSRSHAKQQAVANVTTFDDVARDYIEAKRHEWRNAKHAYQWERTLEVYASPVIGHLAPADITTEHVIQVLKPIWQTKAETGRRVRNRIEIILNAAKARKLRTGENVAAWRGNLELLMPSMKKQARHMPALPWQRVPDFWQALTQSEAMAAPVLMLTLLTGVRSGEARFAHWDEFDLQEKTWTIPAERMKAGRPHRVPLSQAVMDILESIPKVPSGLLFEGAKEGVEISNTAMIMLVRRMDAANIKDGGEGWRSFNDEVIVPHGFRSTFRDWTAEATNTPNIVAEQALSHVVGNAVEAAYRRGDLLERRRELMEAWGAYVTQPSASNVLQLRREA